MTFGEPVKLTPDESLLSVPVNSRLLAQVKEEAKINGMLLREAVTQALTEWQSLTEQRRRGQEERKEQRQSRLESLQ
jgi:hypothetical protein